MNSSSTQPDPDQNSTSNDINDNNNNNNNKRKKKKRQKKLRIAFIHPDLGIGGAERLVVDTAVGLQNSGHRVRIFTSSHDKDRCFVETADGTLSVKVLGQRIFPRSFRNRFITILSILRQLNLTINLLLSLNLPRSINLLLSKVPLLGIEILGEDEKEDFFDVYFIDQLSASIPILKLFSRPSKVLFYCHFPDLLLSNHLTTIEDSQVNPDRIGGQGDKRKEERGNGLIFSTLKKIYRFPLDWLEEFTTGQADKILVNSNFTAQIFKKTFKTLDSIEVDCIYPGVDIELYDRRKNSRKNELEKPIKSNRPTILSINRFESKKNISLLLRAFIILRNRLDSRYGSDESGKPRLILAGGYDSRLIDNLKTLEELYELISDDGNKLTHQTIGISKDDDRSTAPGEDSTDVLFLLNISQDQKLLLLTEPSTKLLGYTPSNEHLGIGPLEGMSSNLPIIATNSGGPKETIEDGITGFLIEPDPSRWSEVIEKILFGMDETERDRIGIEGRRRVENLFSIEVMVKKFEDVIYQVVDYENTNDYSSRNLKFLIFFLITFVVIPFISAFLVFKRK